MSSERLPATANGLDLEIGRRMVSLLIVGTSNEAAQAMTRLRGDGFDAEHRQVDTGEGLSRALDEHAWDAILCGTAQRGFGPAEACRVLHARGGVIPLIAICDPVGEEAAIDLLHAGVADVVLWRNLGRLVPALRRVIDIAETRRERERTEEINRQSESRYRAVSELMSDLVYAYQVAPDGSLSLEWRAGNERLGGLLRPSCGAAQQWIEQVHEDDRAVVEVQLCRLLAGANVSDDLRVAGKAGAVRYLRVSARPEMDQAGQRVVRFVGTIQDVTARHYASRALAESEARFRDFALAASDWFWETDAHCRFVHHANGDLPGAVANPSFAGRTPWEISDANPGETPEWSRFKEKLETRVAFRDFALAITDLKGRARNLRISGKPVFDGAGKFQGYRGTSTDVTAAVEAARRAETAETRLRSAIDSLGEAFVIYDRDDRVVLFNQRWRDIYQIGPQEKVVGARYEDLSRKTLAKGLIAEAKGREEEWLRERIRRHLDPGEPFEIAMADGQWLRVVEQRTADGGIVSIRFDITQLKDRERRLRESEQRFKDFANAASDQFWVQDEDLRFTFVSTFSGGQGGAFEKKAIGRTRWEVVGIDPDRDDKWRAHRADLQARRPFRDFRYAFDAGGGKIVHWRVSGNPVFDADGAFRGYRGVAKDETAEVEALRRAETAEARLRSAIESLDQVFVLYDKDDRVVLCNRKWRELNRLAPDESVEGMPFEEVLRTVLAKGLIPAAKGREREWIEDRSRHHRNAGGSYDTVMEDGRWMRITERRTPDGGIVVIRSDIQEQVDRERRLKESEQRFKDFAESASDHFWEQDERLHYSFVSAADGPLPDPIRFRRLGRTRWELADADPDVDEHWRAHRDDLLARRPFRDFHYSTRETNGRLQYWCASGKPLFDEQGAFRGYRGVARNETAEVEERHRREQAEARLLSAIESLDDPFILYGKDDCVVLHNRKWREYFRPDGDESVIGKRCEEVYRGSLARGLVAGAVGREEEWLRERMERHRNPGPSFEVALSNGRWLRVAERRTSEGGIVNIRTDITALKERERALKESEQRFRDFAESASNHFWEQDEGLRFTFVSAAEGGLADAVPDAMVGWTRWELAGADPDVDERWRAHRDDLLARRPFHDFHYSVRDKMRRLQYWRVSGKPLFDGQGAFRGYRGVAKNETAEVEERQRREKAETWLSDAIESLDEGFAIWGPDDRLVLSNRRHREIFSALADRLVPGVRYREVLEAAAACGIYRKEPAELKAYVDWREEMHLHPCGPFTVEFADGRWIQVSERRTREGSVVGIWTDVTERKRLEAQLLHTQKMESLGTLAGGVAHDVNNTLTPIIGLTELALEDLPPDHPVRPNLERVVGAGQRVKALVGQILAFSRRSEPKREVVPISNVVKEALNLLRATVPATIQIRADISPDAGSVLADATQIHQVILNLSANAAHAMAAKGGVLEIALGRVEIDDAQAKSLGTAVRPGCHVCLTVRDNGHGIDPAVVGRIFDPFFTTKPVGEGTGMGLAMVHGIVTDHGGAVRVTSEMGRGATFEVFLPLAGDADASGESTKP